MRRLCIALFSTLASLGVTDLHAESNSLSAVERPPTAATIFSAPSRFDVGSESYPGFSTGSAVPIVAGGILQPNGSEGIVQTANSLPPGFMNGTPGYEYAQSVQRYFAAQASRVTQARMAREDRTRADLSTAGRVPTVWLPASVIGGLAAQR